MIRLEDSINCVDTQREKPIARLSFIGELIAKQKHEDTNKKLNEETGRKRTLCGILDRLFTSLDEVTDE